MVANGPLDTIILRGDWRRRIVRENEALARRLQAAYERTLPRLRAEIDSLNQRMAELYEINGGLNAQEVRGLRQWTSLMAAIETENRDFAVIARNETAQGQRDAIRAGASAAQEMAQSTSGRLGPALAAAWNRPDPAALERLINYVDGPALRAEFAQFGTRAAEQFADVMLAAVAQGKNPLALARIMELWLSVPYAQAENIARTTQLWSYRSATHAAYRANSEVVTGWLWYSAADDRTCFPAGTLIQTLTGAKAIESVMMGDLVLTHTGRYQRVIDTMKRSYSGRAVTVGHDGDSVTMTDDHPVLVSRGHDRYWIPASQIEIGDIVFVTGQNHTKNSRHISYVPIVERHVGNSDNHVSTRGQSQIFSVISRLILMPVNAINLKRNIKSWQEKINRIFIDVRLLNEFDPQKRKAKPNVLFWHGFDIGLPITSWRTITPMGHGRNNSKLPIASEAGDNYRRTAAFFRTVMSLIPMNRELLLAPLAGRVLGICMSASDATDSVSMRNGDADREVLSTNRACFCDHFRGMKSIITDSITKTSWLGSLMSKLPAALFAGSRNALTLSGVIASNATVVPSTLSDPGGGDVELFPTSVADSFNHAIIISRVMHHIQCEVYNLEVEDDHTYVANGMLVHNCLSCWSQHGSVHSVNEMLADHHRGRCLVPGQSVTTLRGDVAIENVQVGDYVLTHAGNWERVLTLFQRNYTGEVITIESGGYRVTVTPEHPVWTQRGWVEARHLNASDTFRTLCSSEARVSSNKTSHPRCINRLVRLWSMGRFFLVLCQRACHSTANFISGKAKSMLYVSTAICGTGDNPCARNTSRKRYSLSDIWLRVFCLMIAVFSLVSSLCPARIKGVRKSGSFCNWSERDCAGVLGSMPESLMSFIRDRVLMPISLTSCRYDACSSTYRRERYKATGSPILDSSSLSQTLVFRAPINSGDNAGSLKEERLWSTACFALPNAFAMSIADIVSWFSRRNLSSSSDHFLPAMLNSCSTGNSIHHSLYFGKVYDIEVDKDHSFIAGGVAVHNCVPVPVVRGTRWAEDFEPGPVRFAGLDAERQRAIMGPALYAAWRAGDVRWGDFSRPYQDNVFGEMLRAASLRDLLGDGARRYYTNGR